MKVTKSEIVRHGRTFFYILVNDKHLYEFNEEDARDRAAAVYLARK